MTAVKQNITHMNSTESVTTCTRPLQSSMEGAPEVSPSLQAAGSDGCQRRSPFFFQGYGPCEATHVPVDGPKSMYLQAALSGLGMGESI